MDKYDRLLSYVAAQMDGSEIKSAQCRNSQDHQRSQRYIRDAGRKRSVKNEK
jgi:hypothetical protein